MKLPFPIIAKTGENDINYSPVSAIRAMRRLAPQTPSVYTPSQEAARAMNAIAKLNYSHEAMIDLIVANPAISQNELAAAFGYTPSWVSLVRASDAFKEQLAARRAQLVDPTVAATIEERFAALTERSLDVLAEKLALPTSQVPDQLALQAAALGARALGKGGFGGANNSVNVQVNVSSEERLARVRSRIEGLVREKGVVDVEAKPSTGEGASAVRTEG